MASKRQYFFLRPSFLLFLFAVIAFYLSGVPGRPRSLLELKPKTVNSGDTIVMRNLFGKETALKLLGITAPHGQECQSQESLNRLQFLIKNTNLRYRIINDTNSPVGIAIFYADSNDIAKILIREGLARVIDENNSEHHLSFPPLNQYLIDLKQSEQAARKNGLGIWSQSCLSKP